MRCQIYACVARIHQRQCGLCHAVAMACAESVRWRWQLVEDAKHVRNFLQVLEVLPLQKQMMAIVILMQKTDDNNDKWVGNFRCLISTSGIKMMSEVTLNKPSVTCEESHQYTCIQTLKHTHTHAYTHNPVNDAWMQFWRMIYALNTMFVVYI